MTIALIVSSKWTWKLKWATDERFSGIQAAEAVIARACVKSVSPTKT